MQRTQEEILNRIEKRKDKDIFGFECTQYIPYLDYENAKPYIKDGVTKEEWENELKQTDPKAEMKEYISFAFDKADNCRSLSSYRSIMHFVAWLWLDGNEELANKIENELEGNGISQLIEICEYLGLNPDKLRHSNHTE